MLGEINYILHIFNILQEIGSTLAQIRAAHKRSTRTKKEDETANNISKGSQPEVQTPEKNELYMLFEEDR